MEGNDWEIRNAYNVKFYFDGAYNSDNAENLIHKLHFLNFYSDSTRVVDVNISKLSECKISGIIAGKSSALYRGEFDRCSMNFKFMDNAWEVFVSDSTYWNGCNFVKAVIDHNDSKSNASYNIIRANNSFFEHMTNANGLEISVRGKSNVVHSDIDTVQDSDEYDNVSLWAALVGADNCMLNRYGGELYRDNFYVSINKRMQYAKDNAFNLRYSLDMEGISQQINYSDFCTELHTVDNWGNEFWVSYMGMEWAIHHPITKSVKFNYSEFEGSMERLSRDSMAYWATVSNPKVIYKVRIASIKNDPRYSDFLELQNYNYGDSGTIYCPELDISTTQKIIEVEKNELTGDIINMTLGNIQESIIRPKYMGSTISSGNTAGDKQLQAMQDKLTQLEFDINIITPITTIDGKYLTTSDEKYLQYKGE